MGRGRTNSRCNRSLIRASMGMKSYCFFFQAEDGIRGADVTGVQTCALPIFTERIINRSKDSRSRYLEFIEKQQQTSPTRGKLSCGNQAHTYASAPADEKLIQKQNQIGRASCRERV